MVAQITSVGLGSNFTSPINGLINLPTICRYVEDGEDNTIIRINFSDYLDIQQIYCADIHFNNRLDTNTTIKIYLQGDSDTAVDEQVLALYFYIAKNNEEDKRLIFKPKYRSFKTLVFEISKLQVTSSPGAETKFFDITLDNFVSVINKLDKFKISDNNVFGAIGIQGPPYMTFVINDEGLQIGESGTFEAQIDDLYIDFLGFLPKENDIFLVDYNTNVET